MDEQYCQHAVVLISSTGEIDNIPNIPDPEEKPQFSMNDWPSSVFSMQVVVDASTEEEDNASYTHLTLRGSHMFHESLDEQCFLESTQTLKLKP